MYPTVRLSYTTASSSQLEAYLDVAPGEEFPENLMISCQVADKGAHNNVPDDTSPNADAKANSIEDYPVPRGDCCGR
jgi:hypothetical protein